jgi:hypothetical protein
MTGGMQVAYPILQADIRITKCKIYKCATHTICTPFQIQLGIPKLTPYEEFRDGKWHVDGWWDVEKIAIIGVIILFFCGPIERTSHLLLRKKIILETGCINTQVVQYSAFNFRNTLYNN